MDMDHYTHFILAHSKELEDFANKHGDDYYDDVLIIKSLFKLANEEHLNSEFFKEFGVGTADVVYEEEFLQTGIRRFEDDLFEEEAEEKRIIEEKIEVAKRKLAEVGSRRRKLQLEQISLIDEVKELESKIGIKPIMIP